MTRIDDETWAARKQAAILLRQGAAKQAVNILEAAVAHNPLALDSWLDLAEAWRACGETQRAIQCQERVIAISPDHRVAHERLGMLRLAAGDLSRTTWGHYAWHHAMEEERQSGLATPVWDGSDLAGKTIALLGHQGLGDQILFASCVPDVAARAKKVVLFCDARLTRLFARSFAHTDVFGSEMLAAFVARGELPGLQCALGRLPMYLRNDVSAFAGNAFLRADGSRVAAWSQRLRALGPGLKVGISWRGGNPQGSGPRRSIALQEWKDLFSLSGVDYVSLQYGNCEDELAAARSSLGAAIHHWPEAIADYDETAALVCALDVVITVTTAVAHLAGALGKKTLVLVDGQPQWRWLGHGEMMPWYGSMRLVRQASLGRWQGPLQTVLAELVTVSRQTG
jgi:tetratricopeptide (TPR) repeat protein